MLAARCGANMSSPVRSVTTRIQYPVAGAGIAPLVESPTETPGAILTQVPVPGVGKDVNFQCRVLRYPHSPRVQSHSSTSVCTLEIPNTVSQIIVWTHETATHIDRNGWRCSCGCCASYRQGNPNFPQGTIKYSYSKVS